MASKLNPYLQFQDNAREAMTYYQDVFGGDLVVNSFSEFGGEGDGVMHSQLEAPHGFTLMASDTPEGMPPASPGGNITIQCPGKITVHAGKKSFLPPDSMSYPMPQFGICEDCILKAALQGSPFTPR